MAEIIVSALIERAFAGCAVPQAAWESSRSRQEIIDKLSKSIGLFLKGAELEACHSDLRTLDIAGEQPRQDDPLTFTISSHADVVRARGEGMNFAMLCGASNLRTVQLGTVLSKLARNIVLYAQEGRILLRREAEHIVIVAQDSGWGAVQPITELVSSRRRPPGSGRDLSRIENLLDDLDVQSRGQDTIITARLPLK